MSWRILVFFIGFISESIVCLGQRNADSLEDVWNDESEPIIERMNAVEGLHYFNKSYIPLNPDSVLSQATKQFELAQKNELKIWMAHALNSLGNYHSLRGEFDLALENFEKCKVLALDIDDARTLAHVLFNMGVISYKENNYTIGIPLMLESADAYKSAGASDMLYRPWSVIAAMYLTQGDRETSLKYYEMCVHIADSVGDKPAVIGINYTIEMIKNSYKEEMLTDQSQNEFTEKALEQFEEIDDPGGQLLMIADLASTLINAGKYDEAQEKLDRATTLMPRAKNSEGIPILYMQLGRLYSAQNQHDKAIVNLNKALEYIEDRHFTRELQGVSEGLYISYKATGRYKEALDMYEQNVALRDSVTNLENTAAVVGAEIKAEYDMQKALDDLANEKQLAIEQQKKKNQQLFSVAIGGGLLIISILALVIFNRLKIVRRQKSIIEEQKLKVEESEKHKEQFLANMSHEIRTPMHAISGMVKIIARNEHPTTQDAYLKAMRTSCDNLVVILNDVLDLSKIGAGKLDIENIPMSPTSIVENVVQIMGFRAEEKGLNLTCMIEPNIPDSIIGDPTRMNQVLLNLTSNAIKFTEKGSVEIRLTRTDENIEYAVKDTGVGISTEAREKIFTAFNQEKTSTSRLYGGTGLGLSISKQLVELQNGFIRLESEVGRGSTFVVQCLSKKPPSTLKTTEF
jgi:signal transduction histidine kinase